MAWNRWPAPQQRCAHAAGGSRMIIWYLVPSRDPELLVAVGWESVLGSFVARVEGIPTGALLDPDRPTVAWFGSRHGDQRTGPEIPGSLNREGAAGAGLDGRHPGGGAYRCPHRGSRWRRQPVTLPP